MITGITCENLNEFGHTLRSAFELRYESFIERQSYDVKTYQGMEFDQYDTPAAAYLVYHDHNGKALAVNRLTPTSVSCMLNDLFNTLVDDKSLLSSDRIWEGTRYCISKKLDPALRQRIIHEMAIAYLEFGLDRGLDKIIGTMPTYIYRSVFERPGIEMEYLGAVQPIDGVKCRAVAIPIRQEQLSKVRAKTGILNRILRYTLRPSPVERKIYEAA